MAHANRTRAFARPGATLAAAPPASPLTPDDLELSERCARVWRQVLGDPLLMARLTAPGNEMRHRVYRLRRTETVDRSDPLQAVAELLVALAGAGAVEAQVRPVLALLEEVVQSCWTGSALRSLVELDRIEQEADALEDARQLARLQHQAQTGDLDPVHLEAGAEADEHAAAVLAERARVQRRLARQIRLRPTPPAWSERRRGIPVYVEGRRDG